MKVFVAGASGAIGSRLVPQLLERGHDVIGTSRFLQKAEQLRALGAEAVVLDALDAEAVRQAILESEPEAIVHQATALADVSFSRNVDRSFAETNRLRIKGTDALVAAAREAGVRRLVAQSSANFRYAREGGPVKTEEDALDPSPVEGMRETSAAMTYLDVAVAAAGGIALRYGSFYGAGDDGLVLPVRKRQLPIVGSGDGMSSFIHLEDAAAATVLALEHDGPAIYNIVEDEPAPVREWLPVLADALGETAPALSGLACPPHRGRSRGHAGRRPAAPPTRRRSASSAGCRASRAGGKASHRSTPPLKRRGQPRDRLHPRRHAEVGGEHGRVERFRRDRISRTRHRLYRDADRCGPGAVRLFPLSLLGLAGVLAGLGSRTVPQRNPSMNPQEWRDERAGDRPPHSALD